MTVALRSLSSALLPVAAAVLLAACGGGGGSAGNPPPVATSVTAGAAVYSQQLTVTVQGSHLDSGIGANSSGCRNIALVTASSNASTAQFRCTVSRPGQQTFNVTRTSDNGVIGSVNFNAPEPQVTMGFTNNAGVAGQIVITLEAEKAPITVDNFLAYVASGFYVGTIIHRNAPGFVLQGGGYVAPVAPGGALPALKGGLFAPITLEDDKGLSNLRYTVAMARTADPNSATSQFFINLADNVFLNRTATDRGYAVFGTVTTNRLLVDTLANTATTPCTPWFNFFGNNQDCLPTPNIVITSAAQTR
jgi:cyclophilin family peptidyl-prolyl cis-trans isomerase